MGGVRPKRRLCKRASSDLEERALTKAHSGLAAESIVHKIFPESIVFTSSRCFFEVRGGGVQASLAGYHIGVVVTIGLFVVVLETGPRPSRRKRRPSRSRTKRLANRGRRARGRRARGRKSPQPLKRVSSSPCLSPKNPSEGGVAAARARSEENFEADPSAFF